MYEKENKNSLSQEPRKLPKDLHFYINLNIKEEISISIAYLFCFQNQNANHKPFNCYVRLLIRKSDKRMIYKVCDNFLNFLSHQI